MRIAIIILLLWPVTAFAHNEQDLTFEVGGIILGVGVLSYRYNKIRKKAMSESVDALMGFKGSMMMAASGGGVSFAGLTMSMDDAVGIAGLLIAALGLSLSAIAGFFGYLNYRLHKERVRQQTRANDLKEDSLNLERQKLAREDAKSAQNQEGV